MVVGENPVFCIRGVYGLFHNESDLTFNIDLYSQRSLVIISRGRERQNQWYLDVAETRPDVWNHGSRLDQGATIILDIIETAGTRSPYTLR